MANSGNITSNNAGIKYPHPCNLYFEWWESNWNQAENWREITFNLKAGGGAGKNKTVYSNILVSVDGQDWRAGRIMATNGQVLITGTKRLYHDDAGNRGFSVHVEAGIYGHSVNARGDGSWWLDQIPRFHRITGAPDFTDEENPVVTYYCPNRAFGVRCSLEIDGDVPNTIRRWANNWEGSYRFNLTEDERNFIRSKCKDRRSVRVRFYIDTMKDDKNTLHWEWLDRTCTIVPAYPDPDEYTYEDTNELARKLTGDKHVLIKGVSQLKVTVPASQKGVAKKLAYVKSHDATFAGKTLSKPEINGDTVFNFDDITTYGTQQLDVLVWDSRGWSRHHARNVTVLNYAKPVLRVTVERRDNFYNETKVTISGEYDELKYNGEARNKLKLAKYRYRSEQGSWSDWQVCKIDIKDGKFSVKPKTFDFDNTLQWQVEARIEDELNSIATTVSVPIGKPIFRIGVDGYVYNNEQPLMPSHIGQVIMSTTLKTASQVEAIYRGKWEAWGQGKMPVGVDPDDYNFSAPNKYGGNANVQIGPENLPDVIPRAVDKSTLSHGVYGVGLGDGSDARWVFCTPNHAQQKWGEPLNIMPPYQSIYMWVRVA